MANIKYPGRVRFITGILAANEECLQLAINEIESMWGKADIRFGPIPFTYSKYYKDEAGGDILRAFLGFADEIPREKLIEWKLAANELEKTLAKKLDCGLSRPVNIDPGYIAPEKLVLASCKNFAHRIYLGEGVFAEVTLLYKAGKFTTLDWTFPDYGCGDYYPFFYQVRDSLMKEING